MTGDILIPVHRQSCAYSAVREREKERQRERARERDRERESKEGGCGQEMIIGYIKKED